MTKTYQGSCHCGQIQYEAVIDLSRRTAKCNCSICTKARYWLTMVRPENFRLLSGQSSLTDYQFGKKNFHHLFCRHCGVRCFGWGDIPEMGGKVYAINLSSLDDVDVVELINAPVTYVDGLHNNWQKEPDEVRHL